MIIFSVWSAPIWGQSARIGVALLQPSRSRCRMRSDLWGIENASNTKPPSQPTSPPN